MKTNVSKVIVMISSVLVAVTSGVCQTAVISDDSPANGVYASGPIAYAPNVPALINKDTVDLRIDVQNKKIYVNDEVSFTGWVFGDSLPGPVVRVKVGQVVHFTMANRSNDNVGVAPPMPHSIDFHAAMVNPADKYQSVSPGSQISFYWKAIYPGVFMYHCGTPMIMQHMIYGMIGMVIVDPKEGFPGRVDTSFTIIQSELYLRKSGNGTYMPDVMAAKKKAPSYVVFNGKPNWYIDHPLYVKAGQRVRLYISNDGPNFTSSFHIVGTIFDKVWVNGNPANEEHGMQTVLLGASSSAIVEFVLPEAGTYTFVDHDFANVEMGAKGLIIAK